MRTRTKGIQLASDGSRTIEKQYKGKRIFARLGEVSQDEAESYLRDKQREIDVAAGKGVSRLFRDAAAKYLMECQRRGLRSIDSISQHIELIVPWIGDMSLESIHSGTFEAFIDHRLEVDQVKTITVNKTLAAVSAVLLRASRVWRDDEGKPWLSTAPLIETLDETPRQPYPITWDEQARLFKELPEHLATMALFAVNTGLRQENVCGLRWEWERKIPELGRSVFVIPASEFKGKRVHVAILNDVAAKVVESCRGQHPEFVFTFKDDLKKAPRDRVGMINTAAWQKARKRVGLAHVRVHDLRHTFGQRLRDGGVSGEDRAVLMGHATSTMSEHYATPTIARLVDMSNLVSGTRDTATLLSVVNSHAVSHAQRKTA